MAVRRLRPFHGMAGLDGHCPWSLSPPHPTNPPSFPHRSPSKMGLMGGCVGNGHQRWAQPEWDCPSSPPVPSSPIIPPTHPINPPPSKMGGCDGLMGGCDGDGDSRWPPATPAPSGGARPFPNPPPIPPSLMGNGEMMERSPPIPWVWWLGWD